MEPVLLCSPVPAGAYIRPMQPIGLKIKERRKARGLSQTALAKLVGASQQAISDIEKDAYRSTRYIFELIRALDIPIEEIDPSLAQQILAEGADEQVMTIMDLARRLDDDDLDDLIALAQRKLDRASRQ